MRNANYIQIGMLALSIERLKNGLLSNSLVEDNHSSSVIKEASRFYNELITEFKLLFSSLESGFQRISENNLLTTIVDDNWDMDVKNLILNINNLQEIIAKQYLQQLQSSIQLKEFTSELSHHSNVLSTSSNEQASSLEETAAAIEELTSNVSANASKAQSMTQVAKEAKEAAHKGNSVAKESFSAMNEIVNATEAINQAVEMIDNIAFQTNILSLNAAVEAATAGDAGKGFAVVAQEVRNLANRSADAAKEIQELAHRAREKSQGGLETSKNMMESFALISEKIVQTDEMVRDVSDASREQMSGINQINDAVSQLDQMTQQNASTAANVDSIVATVRELSDGIYSDISKKEFVGKEEFLRNAT
jgi:methyl-accepting chemotaxis protein